MDQKISFRIMSLEDDHHYTLPLSEALEIIIKITNEEKKWIYINGDSVQPKNLTAENLLKAKSIILTNAIVGG